MAAPAGDPYRDEAQLAWIRRRSAAATRGLLVAAAGCAGACLALEPYLALMPAAFILGWLNLVGL